MTRDLPRTKTPPSPSASFYDMSDDEEDEYNTILQSSSGRGVKLLYSKSKVYVHPSPSAKDNIAGFIALVQEKPSNTGAERPTSSSSNKSVKATSYLLSWVPEHSLGDARDAYLKIESLEGESPPKKATLIPAPPTVTRSNNDIGAYAFAVPLSEIFSLLIRPPSLGWWYGSVVINTRGGDSFPALFFHDDECQSTILQKKKRVSESFDPFGADGGIFWGGDEILRWIKRYVNVERSTADPSVYLIEPSPEDKVGFGGKPYTKIDKGKQSADGKQGGAGDAGMDPFVTALKTARWGFLEKMSQVTTFARKTAENLFENERIPPQVRRLMKNPEVQTLQEEFDSARVYLARWAMGIAEQGEKDRSQRMWTAKDILEMEESDVGDFEILDLESLNLGKKRQPVTLKEWNGFFEERTGRILVTPEEIKERIFHGGLDPNDGVRKEAWLFLLGVFEWKSSLDERKAIMNSKRDEFIRLKGAWWEKMVDGHATPEANEWWREQKGRIGMLSIEWFRKEDLADARPMGSIFAEKDVHRTDRHIPLFEGEDIPHPDPESPFAEAGTNVHLEQMKDMLLTYNEYNTELGYVQGMSDLLAPIYAVMQDDAVAFWGFTKFMDRMERNFLRDQSGMRTQLLTLDHLVQLMDPKLYLHLQSADSTNFFFFFRMLLVWYKREFEWSDCLRLWESLWTDYLSSNFHLFIALAILEKHRDVILQHLKHFDEVLKYINELSGTMDLESTLIRAESLFRRFQRTVEIVDKNNNFPEPNVRQRKPVEDPKSPVARSSATDTATGRAVAKGIGAQKERTITPELRALLSREVVVLDKAAVQQHGGGVGNSDAGGSR